MSLYAPEISPHDDPIVRVKLPMKVNKRSALTRRNFNLVCVHAS